MNRVIAGVVFVLLLLVAHPIAAVLRAEAPPTPAANEIGTGRLLGGVLTGAMRPMLLTYLWIRGSQLEAQGRHDELFRLNSTMLSLYPNNTQARQFLGWHMAYNLKSEQEREIGWKWARNGLDVMRETPEGHWWTSDWIVKQCGQNAYWLQRYAGPAWREERWWRGKLRVWGKQRYDEDESRFALALIVLGEGDHIFDRFRRANMMELLAYDELVATGSTTYAAAAAAELRALAKETSDNPALEKIYTRKAEILEDLGRGIIPTITADELEYAYPVASALLGMGAAAKNAKWLRASATLYEALGGDVDALHEERRMSAAWVAHVQGELEKRPPLPFD